jgi:hypothetical protein
MVMFQSKYHGKVQIKISMVRFQSKYHGNVLIKIPREPYHGILIATLPWYFDWNITMVF